MDRNQICRDALQTIALQCCPAELFYDLSDDIEEVDDESLWMLVKDSQEKGLTPELLGRLACQQGVNSIEHDPFMMDLLEDNTASTAIKSAWMKKWFEGWSSGCAVLSE